ncbi:hypothetical protein FRC01_002060 [Tulasnella sp. 417]|nr:hypothetical protein FRC01_002060 [Tulasnella sp. 417]
MAGQVLMIQTQRFWREMGIWFELDHPNINPLVGVYWVGDEYYVVSPWMENGSIWSCIGRGIRFDALRVLIGVAKAVEYLHDNNIVHADLKLDNVLLTSNGDAKLTDFGLAKSLDPNFSTSAGTKGAGRFRQAPEVLMGGQRSKASDVWGFGMMIAELLMRKPPFSAPGRTLPTVIYYITHGQNYPSQEQVDLHYAPSYWLHLWDVAAKCWDSEPSKRLAMRSIVHGLMEI